MNVLMKVQNLRQHDLVVKGAEFVIQRSGV